MVRSFSIALLFCFALSALACAESDSPHGGGDRGGRRPVYQRRAFEWMDKHGSGHGRHRHAQFFAPQVSSGWFQRPYPYHLDYYRMRYGGSYAPYFGNLYGTPQVVTVPPYYGPYYGGYGGEAPVVGHPAQSAPGYPMDGAIYEAPAGVAVPQGAPTSTTEESLPPQ